MGAYYLVQRLESKTPPEGAGFDRYFSLDYMGSSEFEWGAIPKALAEVRRYKVAVFPADIEIDGRTRTVYFVTHKHIAVAAVRWMQEWAARTDLRPAFWGKEWSEFPEKFADIPDRHRRTDAWWAIRENVAWALTREVADSLVLAFNTKPVRK